MDPHPTPPPREDPDRDSRDRDDESWGAPSAPPGLDPDPDFYRRALQRLPRWMVLVAVMALPFVWVHGGALWGTSFLVGVIGGYWNYVAVCRVADRLTQRAAQSGAAPSPVRQVLRLLFIAVAVFVIIRFTRINLAAALMGIFTPVAAVVVEILYELGFLRGRS